ncbi:hypothetical protein OHB01_26825 [Microbispora hainanensis]|uniref:hypothetical protein n=1 Tax=Microbispora hainanensis TaxID=568844 RepID=UPI002E298317|nr:hypothetical protein [Microbispora hainanensis]
MTAIDRGALLGLVRARPLLAAELLGAVLAAGGKGPIDGEALRRRLPWTDLASTDAPTLASPCQGIMADACRARAHEAGAAFEGLIAFLRARIAEGFDQADSAADDGEPGVHKAERDLAAKRDRMDFLESVVVHGLYLTVEEHLQAEHLLKLEASAYDWHDDYEDAWQP